MPMPGRRILDMPLGRRFDPARGQLGWLQRWYASQPLQRVVIAVLETDTPHEPRELEAAVRVLCARHHHALGVCLERSPLRLRLRPLTAADPAPWFDAEHADLWQLAAALAHRPFEAGAPLFRFGLTTDRRHIVCAFDHLIADGIAVSVFASELARTLAGIPLPPATDDSTLPLDARLDVRPTLLALARAVAHERQRGVVLAPVSSPAPARLRTRIAPYGLDSEHVTALIRQAREHRVTLHAVLAAAGLHAAHTALGHTHGRLRLSTPVSLRERCEPRPMGMGVFIGGIDTDLDLAAHPDAWGVAQCCMRDLEQKKPDAPRSVGLLVFAGDLVRLAHKREQKKLGRTATLEVSNVGRVPDLPAGTRLWLTQGAHYHGALWVLTVATSSSDGVLRCCLSFPEPLIDSAQASVFMQAFDEQLQAMRHG